VPRPGPPPVRASVGRAVIIGVPGYLKNVTQSPLGGGFRHRCSNIDILFAASGSPRCLRRSPESG